VKQSERNDAHTGTAHIQKNGRVSDVDDPAFVSFGTAVANGGNAGQTAPGIL